MNGVLQRISQFRARYGGRCSRCGDPVIVGTQAVRWSGGRGTAALFHVSCSPAGQLACPTCHQPMSIEGTWDVTSGRFREDVRPCVHCEPAA